jgi:hypothetical protein
MAAGQALPGLDHLGLEIGVPPDYLPLYLEQVI